MKIMSFAAGLAALTTLAPLAATAQTVTTRTVTRTHSEERHGPVLRTAHRTCRVYVRHGHRVRTCRTVRY